MNEGEPSRLESLEVPPAEERRASMQVPEPEDERFVTRVAAELAEARVRCLELLAPPADL